MQLSVADKAICNPRKSTPERRERGKLSRIQGTLPPISRALVKADPPKKRHKSDPGAWLSLGHNLTGASRSLYSHYVCVWKKSV